MRGFLCGAWIGVIVLGMTTQAVGAGNGNGTYTNPPLYADYPDTAALD